MILISLQTPLWSHFPLKSLLGWTPGDFSLQRQQTVAATNKLWAAESKCQGKGSSRRETQILKGQRQQFLSAQNAKRTKGNCSDPLWRSHREMAVVHAAMICWRLWWDLGAGRFVVTIGSHFFWHGPKMVQLVHKPFAVAAESTEAFTWYKKKERNLKTIMWKKYIENRHWIPFRITGLLEPIQATVGWPLYHCAAPNSLYSLTVLENARVFIWSC